MMTCRCCGSVDKLIKSHIIPQAFFRELQHTDEVTLIMSGVEGERTKKSRKGVYDQQILCRTCEAKLSNIDSYGINVLLKNFDQLFLPVKNAEEIIGFEGAAVHKEKLLHFLVSVLWRASVSTQNFYKNVNLGAHEASAKQITFAPKTSSFGVFDAVISKWDDGKILGHAVPPLLDPHKERWCGINAYRFYFGKIVAYIKVDARPFPEPLRRHSLLNAQAVYAISRNFATSSDFKAMISTAQKIYKAEQS